MQFPATVQGLVPWTQVDVRFPDVMITLELPDVMMTDELPDTITTVEFPAIVHGFVPWTTVEFPEIVTGLSALVELSTALIVQSTALDGPPANRTTNPNSVDTGAAAFTTAIPIEDCGSPSAMTSLCITVEFTVWVMVRALNVTVEGSAPLMDPKLMGIYLPDSVKPT